MPEQPKPCSRSSPANPVSTGISSAPAAQGCPWHLPSNPSYKLSKGLGIWSVLFHQGAATWVLVTPSEQGLSGDPAFWTCGSLMQCSSSHVGRRPSLGTASGSTPEVLTAAASAEGGRAGDRPCPPDARNLNRAVAMETTSDTGKQTPGSDCVPTTAQAEQMPQMSPDTSAFTEAETFRTHFPRLYSSGQGGGG